MQSFGNDPHAVQLEWGIRGALGGFLGQHPASESWGDAQPHPSIAGLGSVELGSNRKWCLCVWGPQECIRRERYLHWAGGIHPTSWEGQMRGVMPGCCPAPALQDCVDSWPVYWVDPGTGWVVTLEGDVPASLPSSSPVPGGKHLLAFPQAAPKHWCCAQPG